MKKNKNLLTGKESDATMMVKRKEIFAISATGERQRIEYEKLKKKENQIDPSLLNVGYYLITPLLVGVFLGLLLDSKLRTKPFFTLFFIVLGTVSSFYNLWKIVKRS